MLSTRTILTGTLFAAASPALVAAAPVITGSGSAALSVEDLFTDPIAQAYSIDKKKDKFSLETDDDALAELSYKFSGNGKKKTSILEVDTFNASGEAQGSSFSGLTYTFVTTVRTKFTFTVKGDKKDGLASNYSAEFAGIVADSFLDPDADGGVGGSIGIDGVFKATGILPPGVYSFAISAFEAEFQGSEMEGGATAKIKLAPTHVPLPAASMMGVLTLGAASIAGSLRRPRRRTR